jgi:hypothetical protein
MAGQPAELWHAVRQDKSKPHNLGGSLNALLDREEILLRYASPA